VIGAAQKDSNRVFAASVTEIFSTSSATRSKVEPAASAQVELCAETVPFTKADLLASEILIRRMRKIDTPLFAVSNSNKEKREACRNGTRHSHHARIIGPVRAVQQATKKEQPARGGRAGCSHVNRRIAPIRGRIISLRGGAIR
jgi:hypothetical protein